MKPAILSLERTAVLAVGSDVVLFDNTAHFMMFVEASKGVSAKVWSKVIKVLRRW